MHQAFYDLHIHTALSPCADNDMLPCDIAGMALLNGLDVIAITDHNSMGNVRSVMDAAVNMPEKHGKSGNGLIVLPAIEVSTAEEVHVVCLFDTLDNALGFEEKLSVHYSSLKNREDIFGEQLICNSDDTVAGKMDRMLIAPTAISFDGLFALTREFSGAFVPAHVDRGSFSVMSNLGSLPPDLDIAAIEYTSRSVFGENDRHDYSLFPKQKYILSSDAHQLHAINERSHFMILPEISAKAVIDYLRF